MYVEPSYCQVLSPVEIFFFSLPNPKSTRKSALEYYQISDVKKPRPLNEAESVPTSSSEEDKDFQKGNSLPWQPASVWPGVRVRFYGPNRSIWKLFLLDSKILEIIWVRVN